MHAPHNKMYTESPVLASVRNPGRSQSKIILHAATRQEQACGQDSEYADVLDEIILAAGD